MKTRCAKEDLTAGRRMFAKKFGCQDVRLDPGPVKDEMQETKLWPVSAASQIGRWLSAA
jgi:hypothetical protein